MYWRTCVIVKQMQSNPNSVEATIGVTTAHDYCAGSSNWWRVGLLIAVRDCGPLVLARLTKCWISAAPI